MTTDTPDTQMPDELPATDDELPDLPLQSSWTLYYHKPFEKDWSPESYTKIYTARTVKEFWRLFNNLPKYTYHFWFLMRDDHTPLWEDPINRGRGWVYRIPKPSKHNLDCHGLMMESMVVADLGRRVKHPYCFNVFVHIILSIIGETICKESDRIIGISISPKKNESVIRLWDSRTEGPIDFSPSFTIDEILTGTPMVNDHANFLEKS